MIYIIDHQDSFTWNVVHQFSEFEEVYCSDYFNLNLKLLKKIRCNSFFSWSWLAERLSGNFKNI